MVKPTRKTIGKYDRKSSGIGFHEWNLEAIQEGAAELLNKAFKEALDIATEEYKVTAEFSHKKKLDVATITVDLPIGPEEYVNPSWEFSLSDLVDNEIFDAVHYGEDASRLIALRDRFRALADMMDSTIDTIDKPAA